MVLKRGGDETMTRLTEEGIPSAHKSVHIAEAPQPEISSVAGQQLVLECTVWGEPAPLGIVWLKDGRLASQVRYLDI